MTADLTQAQREGARFLASRRVAYLADVPGLGKTAQYVRAVDLCRARRGIVICPPILRSKLQAEWDLWSHMGHTVHAIDSGADAIPEDGIVVTSYALATQPKVLAQLASRATGSPVIFDEAHALKEIESQRTKACLGPLIRKASHAWFISGTPAPNHAAELFPFMCIAGLWRASDYDAFVSRFCTTRPDEHDPKGWRITGSKNQADLRAILAPQLLRRTIVEGRPPLTLDTIPVHASDAYAALAGDYAAEIQAALSADDWSFADLEHISTVRRLIGLGKVPATISLARAEIESGHKRLLIFGTHVDALEQVTAGLADLGARLVNGQTSSKNAETITREFQSDSPAPQIIVGNMQTMGEAVTLTAASRGIIFEPSWVPKDNTQVIARAWRRGQLNPVHFSFLSVAGSIDDAITSAVARKSRQISELY